MTELNATVDQLSVSVNEISQNATQLAGVLLRIPKVARESRRRCAPIVEVSEKRKKPIWSSVGKCASLQSEISIQITSKEAVDKGGTASGESWYIIKLIGGPDKQTCSP